MRKLLAGCGVESQETFFIRRTRSPYNASSLYRHTGLSEEKRDGAEPTYAFPSAHYYSLFIRCLERGFTEEAWHAPLGEVPLYATALAHMTVAAQLVSHCSGLPADGNVLFSAFQGKAVFHHFGPDRDVQLAAVPDTDSTRALPYHRCSVFVLGESAAGKDTVIALLSG